MSGEFTGGNLIGGAKMPKVKTVDSAILSCFVQGRGRGRRDEDAEENLGMYLGHEGL